MTVVSHTYYKIYNSSRFERDSYISYVRGIFNSGGFVTKAAIGWVAVAVVVYLVATYSVFGLDITLKQQSAVVKDLTESNTITELHLQQRQTEFARTNKDILQSMQKISDMRYVLPTDTTVSRADISDRSSQ